MSVVHVVAIITAKPGRRDEVLRAFHLNIPNVHAEEGCLEYGPTIDTVGVGGIQAEIGPDTFVVIEKWQSVEHLKAHATAPHMTKYGAEVKDLLASRVVHVLSPA
mgnify:CR=1 FL=1